MQTVRRVSLALLLALPALAGCGYKGPLDPPPEPKQETTDKADPNAPKTTRQHKPFVLDGLIN